MKNIKNLANLHVFFIGIGGISMSGLAKMCLSQGAKVSGSDEGESPQLQELESLGVAVCHKHNATNILKDIDIVVYTVAIRLDNPELLAAKALGLKIYERAEFLGKIASKYKNVISISGTHGKTTTTAMIGEIFARAGRNPTIHIGGKSINLQDTTIIGERDYFIVEACEYKNSFRFIKSTTALITNVELDHVDYYKDYNHILSCFRAFACKSQQIILDMELDIRHKSRIDIGKDYRVVNIKYNNLGYDFDVLQYDNFYAHFRLNLLGEHNVHNALYAIATGIQYDIPKDTIIEAISQFKGVERRYENIGNIGKTPIIIDYAHHPSEIASSIKGILDVFRSPLFIFQPHTYTRTLALFNDFVSVLSRLSRLVLYSTYPAREEEIMGGRAEDLSLALGCECFQDMKSLIDMITKTCQSDDIDAIIVLGAGNIADKLKNYFK